MSNNLIAERDERTKRRKKFKQKVDKIYNLSYKDDEKMTLSADGMMKLSDSKIRLLDEGAVVGDDFVSFIIKKGTLEKYLNGDNEVLPNIDPNEKYTVNLGHQDFATFPFIIGEFKKEDLSLVDLEDDRKGIDVALHLDEDSVFVQELKRLPYDIGVSAEFYYHVDWESTENVGILVIDEVYIFAYGLVGECGNVNSSGLELKETNMPNENKDILEEQMEKPEEQTIKESAEEETEIPPTDSEEPVEADETEEETAEESDGEEAETEEADEEISDEGESDEADELAEALSIVESLRAENASLKAENKELNTKVTELTEANESLKKTNRKLNSKLQNEYDKKKAFVQNVKGLSVQLLPDEEAEASKKEKKANREKVTKDSYFHGDGIGEI